MSCEIEFFPYTDNGTFCDGNLENLFNIFIDLSVKIHNTNVSNLMIP